MTDDDFQIIDSPPDDDQEDNVVNSEESLPLVMTAQEVADFLRVSYKSVLNLAKVGNIPAFQIAGQWRFSRSAILKWIEDQSWVDYTDIPL